MFDIHKVVAGFLLGLCVWCGGAAAQDLQLKSSGTDLSCMTRPAKLPLYPERDDFKGLSATFRAQLIFSRPDRKPEVKYLFQSGSDAMAEEVARYIAAMRLPCLRADTMVMVAQEFEFRSKEPEARASEAIELLGENSRAQQWANCLRSPEQRFYVVWGSQTSGSSRQMSGNVLASLSFAKAGEPPVVKVDHATGPTPFKLQVVEYLKQYRLPCLREGEGPVTYTLHYILSDSDKPARAFNDMDLLGFLGAVKNLAAKPASFKFDTMGCPFQVLWTLYAPAQSNGVVEVGDRNPNRAAFLQWLGELQLNADAKFFDEMLGAKMVITVPCGAIEP